MLSASMTGQVSAQNLSKDKRQEMYRMQRNAREAEKNNQFEQAFDIWKYVMREKGVDISSYNGIQRCLSGLERYDEALTFLDTVLIDAKARKNRLKPVSIAADRVSIMFFAERTADAEAAIEQLLQEYRTDPKAYSETANLLFGQRKNEEAIAVYLRGRSELRNPYLYAREIASYSGLRMDWETAISEYLLYLKDSPKRLSYVTGVIGDMPANMGADSMAVSIIQEQRLSADRQFKQVLTQLLASLHFRARRYSQALDAFVSMGGNRDEQAIFLLDFAQMLVDEEEYQFAWNSYNEIQLLKPAVALVSEAYLGIGIVAEKLGQIDSAKAALHASLEPGVSKLVAFQAYSRLGYIEMDYHDSPESARGYLNSALDLVRNIKQKPEQLEGLKVAAALTWAYEKNWKEAEKQLVKIIRSNSKGKWRSPFARSELASLYFLTGEIAKSRQMAESILLSDPSSSQANEALSAIALINDLKSDSLSIIAIGDVDRHIFLKELESAEEIIDSLVEVSSVRVKEEAYWRKYKIKVEGEQFQPALSALRSIIDMGTSAYRADLALLTAGELCENRLHQIENAIEYYETLLIDYPDSPLCDQARRKMKLITVNS